MKESIFAAWHPVEGFGPTNEISLRDHYDHAMTDVRLLSHTGDKRWCVVEVEMKVCPLRTLAPVQQFKPCLGCYTTGECRDAVKCFAAVQRW